MNLFERMCRVNSSNPYLGKDLAKAEKANKFIGRGSAQSSTNKYRMAAGDLANCGQYTSTDVVFISAEGMRRGREEPDFEEIARAAQAHVVFVTDDKSNRERPYNYGEREVAEFLNAIGYIESRPGIWMHNQSKESIMHWP